MRATTDFSHSSCVPGQKHNVQQLGYWTRDSPSNSDGGAFDSDVAGDHIKVDDIF